MAFVKFVLLICLTLGISQAWKADPPYYGRLYADVGAARGLFVDPVGDLLVLERHNNGRIFVIYETENGDGSVDVTRQLLVSSGVQINHSVIFHDGYIYAASQTVVLRWPYTPGSRQEITIPGERVIDAIPNGGHDTRSLIFDSQNRLYVSIGSGGNVDSNSDRARIRRFNIVGLLPIPFDVGEVFADGLRNEVGLAFDANGILHGVENGADQLNRPDLGGDIHNGNPAEEMNRFNRPAGTHYGYPYCFSTHNLAGYSPNTQFAWPSFLDDGTHDDAWCNNLNNNQIPLLAMTSHAAPLGIEFYSGSGCDSTEGSFPCSWEGDAIVAFHGSWNSDERTGYKVSRFPFNSGNPTGEEETILYDLRAANAVFNRKGHLFATDDANSLVIKVTYGSPPKAIRNYVEK